MSPPPSTADAPNRRHGRPPAWLFALGRADMPERVEIGGAAYVRRLVFKHDFFAATGLYDGPVGPIVLKLGRRQPAFGLSLNWIGRFLIGREAKAYRSLAGFPGVPAFVGMLNHDGFAHAFAPGRPLRKNDQLPDDFFPALSDMLAGLHARGMAYVDLEKRENILLGDDGRPCLIDFQISFAPRRTRGLLGAPARLLLKLLKASDRYHLMKHWRRLRPDQFAALAPSGADDPPVWILWHRRLFRPITLLRRRALQKLGVRADLARGPG